MATAPSSVSSQNQWTFVVRTNSFLDRKKWRPTKPKAKGNGKAHSAQQARGVATVNALVAERALFSLALSPKFDKERLKEQEQEESADPPPLSTSLSSASASERDKAAVELNNAEQQRLLTGADATDSDDVFSARVLCEDADASMRVRFIQDGRFLVLHVHLLADSASEDATSASDDEADDEEEADLRSAALARLGLSAYPPRVARVLRALLVQSAVLEISPSFVVSPAPLSELTPPLLHALKPIVSARAPAVASFKLTSEPSVWPGQKHAATDIDSDAFPAPSELHKRLSAALSAALALPSSRDMSASALRLRVDLGRAQAYASVESHVRVKEERYRSHPRGSVSEVVLFAMGEVHLKLGNKTGMINEVMRRVRYRCGALASWSEREHQLHFVVYPARPDLTGAIVDIVRRCPGVEWVRRCTRVDVDEAAIVAQAVKLLEAREWRDMDLALKNNARQVFPSKVELKKRLSDAIGQHFQKPVHSSFRKRGTDLVLDVRLTPDNAYLSVDCVAGVGGLPVNKQQQSVVALLSGGMDSPVAAYMMMKRGCQVVLVHFQNHLQMASAVQDKIVRIAGQLTHYQDHIVLYTVPFAELQAAIIERVPGNERMLVYRRCMTLLAARIADLHAAKFLVLGDAFSQVASQTVHNLAAIYERTEKPILAPLMGMNKEETMDVARAIGTWELSALPYGDCCSFFLDAHPALHMRGERLRLDEYMARIDIARLTQRALEGSQILKLKRSEGVLSTFEVRPLRAPDLQAHHAQLLDEDAADATCAVPKPVSDPRSDDSDDEPSQLEKNELSDEEDADELGTLRVHKSHRAPVLSKISGEGSEVRPAPVVDEVKRGGESSADDSLIYLDNAATTACSERCVRAMLPFLTSSFGNAASLHRAGDRARLALDESRATIARALGADASEIVFTSGGTESNNLALVGAVRQIQRLTNKTLHVVTTAIEHASVLEPLQKLAEAPGRRVVLHTLKTDRSGLVSAETLQAAFAMAAAEGSSVALVSIAHANNEIGSVQDLARLAAIAKAGGALVHVDACQSFTKVALNVRQVPVDLVTVNAHKLHGPKGVGALYVRKGVILEPLARGGSQEWNLRAGTSNIPGIVGFAEAVRVAEESADTDIPRMRALTQRLLSGLESKLGADAVNINGPPIGEDRLCNNLSVQFKSVEGDALLRFVARHGLCCSSASACHADVDVPSHVLLAIGCNARQAKSTLRLTLSRNTTEKEIEAAVAIIASYFK